MEINYLPILLQSQYLLQKKNILKNKQIAKTYTHKHLHLNNTINYLTILVIFN